MRLLALHTNAAGLDVLHTTQYEVISCEGDGGGEMSLVWVCPEANSEMSI